MMLVANQPNIDNSEIVEDKQPAKTPKHKCQHPPKYQNKYVVCAHGVNDA